MSFLNNLIKGFIRSAVNQVGRDGGKVISNQVYGDKHATPVRMSGHNKNESAEPKTLKNQIRASSNKSREDLLNSGYQEAIFEHSFISNFFLLIGSFIIPFIGSLYWLIIGVKNFRKKRTLFYGYKKENIYKADKRHTTGRRIEGFKNVKVFSEYSPKATKSERTIYIVKGVISLLIFIFYFSFWYVTFFADTLK